MVNLTKTTKQKLKDELDRIANLMVLELNEEKLTQLNRRYEVVSNLLTKTEWKVSPDTVLVIAGNLIGIILILKYEQLDVVTSKALSFVMKGRV